MNLLLIALAPADDLATCDDDEVLARAAADTYVFVHADGMVDPMTRLKAALAACADLGVDPTCAPDHDADTEIQDLLANLDVAVLAAHGFNQIDVPGTNRLSLFPNAQPFATGDTGVLRWDDDAAIQVRG